MQVLLETEFGSEQRLRVDGLLAGFVSEKEGSTIRLHRHYADAELPEILRLAQEQRSDIAGIVQVHPMKVDKRAEAKKASLLT